jgi:hypothetical protein
MDKGVSVSFRKNSKRPEFNNLGPVGNWFIRNQWLQYYSQYTYSTFTVHCSAFESCWEAATWRIDQLIQSGQYKILFSLSYTININMYLVLTINTINSSFLLEDVFCSESRLCLCQQYEQCRVFIFLTKRAIVGRHFQRLSFRSRISKEA